jgi:hypothetical protein
LALQAVLSPGATVVAQSLPSGRKSVPKLLQQETSDSLFTKFGAEPI